jgi:hypothetical protein
MPLKNIGIIYAFDIKHYAGKFKSTIMNDIAHPTFGNGKICYLELPSRNINESAAFYSLVFNWTIRTRTDGSVAFDDTVNEVSGTWRLDRRPANTPGLLVHIMVTDIETTAKLISTNGGAIVQPIGMEAPEITARFSDPSGNILGLYQQ